VRTVRGYRTKSNRSKNRGCFKGKGGKRKTKTGHVGKKKYSSNLETGKPRRTERDLPTRGNFVEWGKGEKVTTKRTEKHPPRTGQKVRKREIQKTKNSSSKRPQEKGSPTLPGKGEKKIGHLCCLKKELPNREGSRTKKM